MPDRYGTISISPEIEQSEKAPQRKTPRKKSAKKPSGASSPNVRPLIISFSLFLILVGIYAAAGFTLVPKLIQTWLPEKVRESTNTQLNLTSVKFNPFTFSLSLDETSLIDPKSKKLNLLSFSSLEAHLAPLSMLRGDFVTKNLRIEQAQINVVRYKDTTYNFTPLIKSLRSSEQTEFMDFSELPFLFSLNNITVRHSQITFQDIPNATTHSIDNIDLTLPNISNFDYEVRNYIRPHFTANINGSPLELTSQTAYPESKDERTDKKTELACNINQLDLSRYLSYIPSKIPINLKQGVAEGVLKLTFTPNAEENKLLAEFDLQINAVKLADKNNKITIDIPSAKVEGAVHPVTGDTYLKQVVFSDPTFNLEKGSARHLFELISPAKEQQEMQPGILPAKTPEVAIDLLMIDNGVYSSFNPSDKKKIDQWESVQFTLKNYFSKQRGTNTDKPTFRINAKQVDNQATMSWNGDIDNHNLPTGHFKIDNIDSNSLFQWLDLSVLKSSSGTADMTGILSIVQSSQDKKQIYSNIEDGSLVLHDLTLKQTQHVWYSAPVTKFEGLKKEGAKTDLGNIYLKNCSVNLNSDKLPSLFASLQDNNSQISFKALDYKGELQLHRSQETDTPPLKFSGLSLQAINLDKTSADKNRDNITFKANLATGGEIQAKGKISLQPFSTVLNTAFHKTSANEILPWFGKSIFFTGISGELQGKGTFIFPEVSFNGQLSINNGLLGKKSSPYMRWTGLDLKDIRINRNPNYFGGSELKFTSPVLTLARDNSSPHPITSIVKFLSEQTSLSAGTKKKGINLSSIEIQKVSFSDGSIEYKDNRTTPPWKGNVSYLRGTIDKIINKPEPSTISTFSIYGNLDNIPFTIDGSLNFFDLSAQGNCLFNMKGYPFASFHEQLTNQTDINTGDGELSVTTRTDWNNGILNEHSQILFKNVQPNSENASSALTIALLTNNDNEFELLIDNKRKLTEPSDPLLNNTLTAFRKLIIKASVSPFLIASGDYSDMAGNEFAEFLPGQIMLSGQGRESLTRFSSLLSAHPNLGIVITGASDKTIDTNALHEELEQEEMERVAIENDKRRKAYDKIRAQYAEQLKISQQQNDTTGQIVEQQLPPELLKPLDLVEPEPIIIDNEMLQHLAKQRAQVIVDFFTDKLALEEDRITIAERPILVENSENSGNKVFFRLQAVKPD